ncbi:hypothetical protein K491DRAFT_615451, partial [Lophiostoma macrostomum CBS 122681]
NLVYKYIFYINKEGFLLAFYNIYIIVFIVKNYKKAFKVLKLILINTLVVLN